MGHGCRILFSVLLAFSALAPGLARAADPRLEDARQCYFRMNHRVAGITSFSGTTPDSYLRPSLRGTLFKYLFRMPSDARQRLRVMAGSERAKAQLEDFEEYLNYVSGFARQFQDQLRRACYLKCVTDKVLTYEPKVEMVYDTKGKAIVTKEFAKQKLILTFKPLPQVFAEGKGSCMEYTAIMHELGIRSGLKGEPVTNESLTHAFYSFLYTDPKTYEERRIFADPQDDNCTMYDLEMAPTKSLRQSIPEWYKKLKDAWVGEQTPKDPLK